MSKNSSQGKSISYSSLNRKLKDTLRKTLNEANEDDLKNLLVLNSRLDWDVPEIASNLFRLIIGQTIVNRLSQIEKRKKLNAKFTNDASSSSGKLSTDNPAEGTDN